MENRGWSWRRPVKCGVSERYKGADSVHHFAPHRSISSLSPSAMKSIYKETPCEQYFVDHISEVLPIAASVDTFDHKIVRDWIDTQWPVFRMRYKLDLDTMREQNFLYTDKYLKAVVSLSLS